MECLTNSRGKKILWVRCPLITLKKLEQVFMKNRMLTLHIFRNAHQFFHIFLIIFNRYPWGISSENKRK